MENHEQDLVIALVRLLPEHEKFCRERAVQVQRQVSERFDELFFGPSTPAEPR